MVLFELGVAHDVEFVDIYSLPHSLIADGAPFAGVNSKNAVPALRLDDGGLLTEVGVILQYVGDLQPVTSLLPRAGSIARYRVMEWLSYVGSDVHKTIGPLFNSLMPDAAKEIHRLNLDRRLAYIENILADQPYLTGETFTVADAYLFVMIGWKPYLKFDLAPYPNLTRFHAKVASRPSFAHLLETVTPVLHRMNLRLESDDHGCLSRVERRVEKPLCCSNTTISPA
jgi:glutathione S-transferase